MPSAPSGPPASSEGPARVRLDSWKEIARYLGRAERTVKRWEAERALPVHRLPGGGHASVYAFAAELDEWLLSEKPKQADLSQHVAGFPVANGGPAPAQPSAESPPEAILLPSPSPSMSRAGWSWRLSAYILLFVCAALAIVFFVNLRTTRANTSSLFHSWLARTKSGSSSSLSNQQKLLAHDLYLKGRYEWAQRTPGSLNRALDCFTQSIVHDPGSAQAYVGLADTYILLREYSTMPESEAYARAIVAARKAVELDDSLAEAHRALAFAETNGNWDFVTGEKEYRRAMQLNPADSVAHLWFANSFASPGWFQECLAEIDRAQELDPSSHAILADKGLLLFKAGKKQEAIELLKQVERTDPEFRSPHFYLMLISFWLRDYPTYLAEGEKAAQAVNDPVLKDTIAKSRAGFTRDGERGLLRNLYAAQTKYYAAGKIPGMLLARTCLRMGKKEEALQLLEEEYSRHSAVFLWCMSDPDWFTLKDEPQYDELLKKINFPAPPQDSLPGTFAQVANPPLHGSSAPHWPEFRSTISMNRSSRRPGSQEFQLPGRRCILAREGAS